MTAKIQLTLFEKLVDVVVVPVVIGILGIGLGLFSWGRLTEHPEVLDIWIPLSLVTAGMIVAGWIAFLTAFLTKRLRYAMVAAAITAVSWQWGLPALTSITHTANFGSLHQGCDRQAVQLGLKHMPGAATTPRAQARTQ